MHVPCMNESCRTYAPTGLLQGEWRSRLSSRPRTQVSCLYLCHHPFIERERESERARERETLLEASHSGISFICVNHTFAQTHTNIQTRTHTELNGDPFVVYYRYVIQKTHIKIYEYGYIHTQMYAVDRYSYIHHFTHE